MRLLKQNQCPPPNHVTDLFIIVVSSDIEELLDSFSCVKFMRPYLTEQNGDFGLWYIFTFKCQKFTKSSPKVSTRAKMLYCSLMFCLNAHLCPHRNDCF